MKSFLKVLKFFKRNRFAIIASALLLCFAMVGVSCVSSFNDPHNRIKATSSPIIEVKSEEVKSEEVKSLDGNPSDEPVIDVIEDVIIEDTDYPPTEVVEETHSQEAVEPTVPSDSKPSPVIIIPSTEQQQEEVVPSVIPTVEDVVEEDIPTVTPIIEPVVEKFVEEVIEDTILPSESTQNPSSDVFTPPVWQPMAEVGTTTNESYDILQEYSTWQEEVGIVTPKADPVVEDIIEEPIEEPYDIFSQYMDHQKLTEEELNNIKQDVYNSLGVTEENFYKIVEYSGRQRMMLDAQLESTFSTRESVTEIMTSWYNMGLQSTPQDVLDSIFKVEDETEELKNNITELFEEPKKEEPISTDESVIGKIISSITAFGIMAVEMFKNLVSTSEGVIIACLLGVAFVCLIIFICTKGKKQKEFNKMVKTRREEKALDASTIDRIGKKQEEEKVENKTDSVDSNKEEENNSLEKVEESNVVKTQQIETVADVVEEDTTEETPY